MSIYSRVHITCQTLQLLSEEFKVEAAETKHPQLVNMGIATSYYIAESEVFSHFHLYCMCSFIILHLTFVAHVLYYCQYVRNR